MQVRIRQAQPADRDQLAQLREALWPATSAAEHARELDPILAGNTPGAMPLTNFVAEIVDGTLVGFAEVDLRPHADGCNPERPVGYLEGWVRRGNVPPPRHRQAPARRGGGLGARPWLRRDRVRRLDRQRDLASLPPSVGVRSRRSMRALSQRAIIASCQTPDGNF